MSTFQDISHIGYGQVFSRGAEVGDAAQSVHRVVTKRDRPPDDSMSQLAIRSQPH